MIEKVARNPSEVKLLKETFNKILLKGKEKDVMRFMQDLTRAYITEHLQKAEMAEKVQKVKEARAETN